jgi:CRISPR/Cas system CSM-associated protein Csm2 small subunit
MEYRGKEYNTMGEVFNLALKLAKEDTEEAKNWFYEYVNYISMKNHFSWDKSIEIAKSNLGYFAGYYDRETCDIINKVYGAQHPIFGCNPFDVSPENAFNKGMEIGLEEK